MTRSISASVGAQGGVNRTPDVRTVQQLLNGVSPAEGGPSVPLGETGQPSSKLNKDIQRFQLKHFGWRGADGRVDPAHQTIAKLNALTKKAPSKPPPPPGPPGPSKPVVPEVLSSRFALVQVGEPDELMSREHDFFFKILDLENPNFPQVYWLGPPGGYRHARGRAKITRDNYQRKRVFKVKRPLAITDLECRAMYITNPSARRVKGVRRGVNRLVLRLESGTVAIDTYRYLPLGKSGGSTDTGKPVFVRQGQFQLVDFGTSFIDDRVLHI